jgi:hypothetical protein
MCKVEAAGEARNNETAEKFINVCRGRTGSAANLNQFSIKSVENLEKSNENRESSFNQRLSSSQLDAIVRETQQIQPTESQRTKQKALSVHLGSLSCKLKRKN